MNEEQRFEIFKMARELTEERIKHLNGGFETAKIQKIFKEVFLDTWEFLMRAYLGTLNEMTLDKALEG